MKKNPNNWVERFWALPIMNALLSWSKRTSLPGLFGVPIYDIIIFIRKELQNHDITTRANSMAFSFFLSLFPAMIMFFTFIAYLPMADILSANIETTIKSIMPGDSGTSVVEVIESVTKRRRTALMSLSFVLALIFSSNGIFTMLMGFNKQAYEKTFKKLSFFRGRWIALKLLVILVMTLLVSIVFGIMGNTIVMFLSEKFHFTWLAQWGAVFLRWFVTVLIYYASISFIYRYGMQTRKRQRFFSTGATLAAVLSLLTSLAFSFYVNNYSLYNKIYGPIGTLIVTMLWIQLN
ncbi:MAG TPA: YihY/virulence factor BrkB family protein, partial [Saprospiraceae bacterium]|nr:YihY/virulence factor BrkB family protein [Saprospiraceae bacterium]